MYMYFIATDLHILLRVTVLPVVWIAVVQEYIAVCTSLYACTTSVSWFDVRPA